MLKKTLFLFGVYSGIILLNGCLRCSDDYPYYDFYGFDFQVEKDAIFEGDTVHILTIIETDIVYLSNVIRGSMVSSAFATQECPGPGNSGKKYEIISMTVTSNNDWDDDHPAGTNLTSLIKFILPVFNTETGLVIDELVNVEENLNVFDFYGVSDPAPPPLRILLPKPSLDREHKLTFTIEKSSGEAVEATTEAITWE